MENADLSLQPQLRLVQRNGEYNLMKDVDLERHRYGDLVYVEELGLLADMRDVDPDQPGIRFSDRTIIPRARIPTFLAEHATDIERGRFRIDGAPERRG